MNRTIMNRAILIVSCTFILWTGSTAPAMAVSAGSSRLPPPSANSAATSDKSVADARFTIVLLVTSLLLANVAAFALVIAHEYPRSLAFDSADAWDDPRYLRNLPNVLRLLSIRGFRSVWPSRCNPWSEHAFERALLKAVRPVHGKDSKAFVLQHLAVWRWVISHRSIVQQSCRRRLQRAVRNRLMAANSSEPAALLAFLNDARLSDAQDYPEFQTRLRLRRLLRIQTILREHGYSAAPEFDLVDSMEKISDENFPECLVPAGKMYRTLLKDTKKPIGTLP